MSACIGSLLLWLEVSG